MFRFTVLRTLLLLASQWSVSLSAGSFYHGCNVTQGCFGSPQGCISTKNCTYLLSYRTTSHGSNGPVINIGLNVTTMIPNNSYQYIAVGFSKDQIMGDDFVLQCTTHGAAQSFNTFDDESTNLFGDALGSGLSTQSVIGGYLSCNITQPQNVTVFDNTFNLLGENYYLFIAAGPLSINNTLPAGQIAHHTMTPLISRAKVNLSIPAIVTEDTTTAGPSGATQASNTMIVFLVSLLLPCFFRTLN